MMRKWNNAVLGIGLGQLLSLLLTFTTFASSELENKGVYAPSALSLLSYLLLLFIYGGIFVFYRSEMLQLGIMKHSRWVSVYEVFANHLLVKAKESKLTCLTSIMLMDCWKISCAVLLTYLFLNTKYTFRKLVGVTICTAGFVTFIFSHFGDTSSKDRFSGDLLIIIGATSFGVSNLFEEILVKVEKADHVQLMAFVGFNGVLGRVVLIALYERNELKSIYSSFSLGAIFPFIGFCLAMFLFYSGVPLLLKISGSTMLNLSLLTSDMWVVLIQIFAYHQKVDWIYCVSFAVVTLGLIIYSWGDLMDAETVEFKHFDEEFNASHPGNVGISNLEVTSSMLVENCSITIKKWWNTMGGLVSWGHKSSIIFRSKVQLEPQ